MSLTFDPVTDPEEATLLRLRFRPITAGVGTVSCPCHGEQEFPVVFTPAPRERPEGIIRSQFTLLAEQHKEPILGVSFCVRAPDGAPDGPEPEPFWEFGISARDYTWVELAMRVGCFASTEAEGSQDLPTPRFLPFRRWDEYGDDDMMAMAFLLHAKNWASRRSAP